jgi:hypothetical protein
MPPMSQKEHRWTTGILFFDMYGKREIYRSAVVTCSKGASYHKENCGDYEIVL